MKYVKAETILPDKLVEEIQKYIQGGYVYIPARPESRKRWGENSGNREYIRNRNLDIRDRFISGDTIKDLAEEFYLSIDSIKKIVYEKTSK